MEMILIAIVALIIGARVSRLVLPRIVITEVEVEGWPHKPHFGESCDCVCYMLGYGQTPFLNERLEQSK